MLQEIFAVNALDRVVLKFRHHDVPVLAVRFDGAEAAVPAPHVLDALERALEGLILDTYKVTLQTVGGVWIMRALRAVPALQQVRLASHAAVHCVIHGVPFVTTFEPSVGDTLRAIEEELDIIWPGWGRRR